MGRKDIRDLEFSSFFHGIEDTIEVLEKTKSSFKSKELGDLRKKLEGLMKTLS